MLAACGSMEGEFPSLERRAYETGDPIAEPETPPAPVILPPAIAAKIDELLQRHQRAQAAFQQDLPSVRTLALKAAGSSPGTESWVDAHLRLSRLDKIRADSVAAMRALDALITAEAERDATLLPLLSAAQKPVADAVTAQSAEINRLSRLIGE